MATQEGEDLGGRAFSLNRFQSSQSHENAMSATSSSDISCRHSRAIVSQLKTPFSAISITLAVIEPISPPYMFAY